MAISSVLLRPFPPLLPDRATTSTRASPNSKKLLPLRSLICRCSLKADNKEKPFNYSGNNISSIREDSDYKLLWKEELKRAFPSETSSNRDWENINDDEFQELVDKRCVDNVRMLIVDSVQEVRAGHPGMALGMAEIGYYLYRHVMRYNPRNPTWFNRDRFVLSAGHGCLLQYVCLHLAGFQSVQVRISLLLGAIPYIDCKICNIQALVC